MRRVERGDLLDASQTFAGEVYDHVRDKQLTCVDQLPQALLHAIGLGLHAVDKYAPHLSAVDAPPLKHVPRWVSALARIRRRKAALSATREESSEAFMRAYCSSAQKS